MPIRQEFSGILYTNQSFDALAASLSVARLDAYLKAANFDKPRALELYVWNAQIAEDFQFPIHIAEVALRNAVNGALQSCFAAMWNEYPTFLGAISQECDADLKRVESRLRRRYGVFSNGQLVAAMPFGFWVYILEPRFHRSVWRPRLRQSFPGLPPSRSRKSVHSCARAVLELRNRIAHHEPLLKLDLSGLHTQAVDLISWICPETAAWVSAHSSVQLTLRRKP